MNQNMFKTFIRLSLGISLLSSGEVDQYLAWSYLPTDNSDKLNTIYNREIKDALIVINQQTPDCSCEEAAAQILQHFGVVLNSPIEQHIKQSSDFDRTPSFDTNLPEYFRNSIYWKEPNTTSQSRFQEISLDTQIDEIINIGGVYIGVDKLTHFMGSGYLYYQAYRIALKGGASKEEAIKTAINIGVFGESKVLGKFASGVFSYADLESNYQGFVFAKNLCSKNEPYLQKTTQGWKLVSAFDINDYVNPFWDESYNPSFYYGGFNLTFMSKSEAVLKNLPKFCDKYQSKEVQSIFTYYDSIASPSFSVEYLKLLIDNEDIPNPNMFNIRTICEGDK